MTPGFSAWPQTLGRPEVGNTSAGPPLRRRSGRIPAEPYPPRSCSRVYLRLCSGVAASRIIGLTGFEHCHQDG